MAEPVAATRPFRVFSAQVRRTRRLSPSFLRVTFCGADLDAVADNGFDQRIKLLVPPRRGGLADLDTGSDWHAAWRALPDDRRPPMRTYTVRAVRPAVREVDVDLVLHGDVGPASRWAGRARHGDPVALVGPDRGFDGDHGGVEFRPPPHARSMLLAGDETAVPAVAGILERLPHEASGEVLLEVPDAADALPLTAPPGMRVRWLARQTAPHGQLLHPAVETAAARLLDRPLGGPRSLPDDVDVDGDVLWDVPDADGPGAESPAGLYAWLAGEAGVIKALRRHLVGERGLDRRSVAFMGYWRLGRSEDR